MAELFSVLLGVAAASGAVGMLNKSSQGRQSDHWSAAGSILGIRYNRGRRGDERLLTGMVDGFDTRVETVRHGNGLATRYELQYPTQTDPFTLTKQSTAAVHALKKMTGQTDILINDDDFDNKVVIDATDSAVMDRYLTAHRRRAVLHLFDQSFLHASVTNNSISIHSGTQQPSAEEIVRIVTGMVMTAEIMSEPFDDVEGEFSPAHAQPATAPSGKLFVVPQLAESEQTETPQDAVQPSSATGSSTPAHAAEAKLSPVPPLEPSTPDVEPELSTELPPPPVLLSPLTPTEPDAPTVLKRPAEIDRPAPPVIAPIAEESETDESDSSDDITHSGPVVDLAPVVEADDALSVEADDLAPEAEEEPTAENVSLDQQDVIADLLGSGRMGFETDERFASHYAGNTISWQGTVDTVRDFRHDTDFKEAGKKVTLLLGSTDDSTLLSHRVFAVIAVSPDTKIERGEELSFTGDLHRLDRFTKQLILLDAELDWPLQQTG